jgi:hypothetical protein
MERRYESQSEAPPATAADALVARVDELLEALRAHTPLPDDAREALRVGILSLARQHAAETILATITARASRRAATRRHRPWGRWP